MNVYEMEGFLRGKCLPGDLLVGESHAAYLVRKLNESATLKADRDAQQKRADALAVENAGLKAAGNKMFLSAISLMEDPELIINHFRDVKDWERNETPATDAALAAIEARGVEKAIDLLLNKFSGTGHVGVPVMALESLAAELREAK